MRVLHSSEATVISGGQCLATCQEATLFWLEQCSYEQLQLINLIFFSVVTSPELVGADDATIKAAMIAAIEQSQF